MKVDLGRTIGILANVGVIAGIVFLGYELRQNNELLASQARSNLDDNRNSMQLNLVENAGGIADIIFKARTGEQLTEPELWRLGVRRSMLLYSYESMYRETVLGPLSENDIPVTQWAASFRGDPGMLAMWEGLKGDMDPDFAKFMDESVLPIADRLDDPLWAGRERWSPLTVNECERTTVYGLLLVC